MKQRFLEKRKERILSFDAVLGFPRIEGFKEQFVELEVRTQSALLESFSESGRNFKGQSF